MRPSRPNLAGATAWLAALALFVAPALARAELTVSTLEGPSWPATVAALQADLHGQGRTVHAVVADESGRRAPCNEYSLALDDVGRAAFAVGACDPATQATPLVLVNRSALFSHDDIVAHPLTVTLAVTQVRSGAARGGAGDLAGSEARCSVALRPYLRDMEHGTVVYLTPGRFVLRPVGAPDVTATAEAESWQLHGSAAGSVSVAYEVVDTARGEVVLRDRATLSCSVGPVAAATAFAPPAFEGDPACPDAEPLPLGLAVHGSTAGRASRFVGSCGASYASPERVYALQIAQPSVLSLRLSSNYDGVLYLRRGCSNDASELACNDDDRDTRHSSLSATLQPGSYFVFVDGYSGASGEYDLTAQLMTLGGEAAAFSPAMGAPVLASGVGALALGSHLEGDTSGAPSHESGSCGNTGSAPERVYQFTTQVPTHVELRLSSDYDGVLYVRDAASGFERGCNDDTGDTHHSSLSLDLSAGTYLVFVDGYSGASGHFSLDSNVPVVVGPQSLAAGQPRGGLAVGAGYFMSIPTGAWDPGVGAVAELRGRIPLGSGGTMLVVGARSTVEWLHCESATPALPGVPSGCDRSGSAPSHFDATLWTAGLPLALQFGFASSTMHIGFQATPALLWLSTPNAVQLGASLSTGLTIDVSLGRLRTFVESGYRFTWISAAAGPRVPSLDGLYLAAGFGF